MDVVRDSGSAAPEVPGYDVGRLLGRGGTAAVWLVTEQSTRRDYALKCFDPGGETTEEGGGARAREAEEAVRREVRILSALDHDHLLRAHAVLRLRGPWSGPDSGDALALLLDYAPGGSVAELVAGRGRLGAGETVTVLTPIAQALEYLHSQGFTHGDVSPGNVLFTAHGKPLLADAGLARMVADVGSAGVAGTQGFSDPAPVDAVRAGLQPERDVYSLAAVGWYCLTGQPPGPGVRRPPLPLLVPGVPAALAAALEAGLDEERRRRPSAAELAAAVYRSAAAEPVDLSVTAHPSVVPQLLTRRAVPRTARERRA
ncbi:protein kinase [Arthrobacter sp. NicSoilB8]|uniref:protein kinase domain-containing protein n=1 Tax=Arthrobacter sp. NicSoilB8 TaxID=2830998 RepID=UPI001CC673E9|nr:protein kinase [Arthrobacter sp. NicSoilB8]